MAAPRSLLVAVLAGALVATAVPGSAQTQREVDDAQVESDAARRGVEDAATDALAANAALLEGLETYEAVNRELASQSERALLREVLNLIIAPSDDGRMPGAGEYDVGTYIGMMKHNVNTIVEALK